MKGDVRGKVRGKLRVQQKTIAPIILFNEALGSFCVPICSDKNPVALNICDTNLLPGLTGFTYRSFRVEPGIIDWGLVFVTDFLMEQAALSRLIDRGDTVVAARFEAFVGGVELANGYWEELNPETLRQRFESDNAVRRQRGQATRDIDPRFMHAMNAGLPDCSGVALGFDRLLMLAQGHTDMSTILPFTWSQA